MPRPQFRRRVGQRPRAALFKPSGIPARDLDEIQLTLDECEALRLADLEGLYQEVAAEQMGISRQTFGRILNSAHRKTAEALVRGRSLRISGGSVSNGKEAERHFLCLTCGGGWDEPFGKNRPVNCHKCGADTIRRVR